MYIKQSKDLTDTGQNHHWNGFYKKITFFNRLRKKGNFVIYYHYNTFSIIHWFCFTANLDFLFGKRYTDLINPIYILLYNIAFKTGGNENDPAF